MTKQSPVSRISNQRKWQLTQQQALHQSRMKQQSIRCRTSGDYRHKRMP